MTTTPAEKKKQPSKHLSGSVPATSPRILRVYKSYAAIKKVKESINRLDQQALRLADQGQVQKSDRAFDAARSLGGHLPYTYSTKRS